MSTLFNERTPFDLLFRNLFKADGVFQPTTFENKQPHAIGGHQRAWVYI